MTRKKVRRMETMSPAAARLRQSDVPMKSWEGRTLRSINFKNEVVTVVLLAAFFGALIGAGWEQDWDWMLVAGGLGFLVLVAVYLIYLVRTHMPEEKVEWQDVTSEPEPEPIAFDAGRVVIPHPDGRIVEFNQPKPGEFAAWIKVVIRDFRDSSVPFRDKAQLSQNTAVKRGWPKDMHRQMIVALRSAGFVHTGANSTPVLTHYGADAIMAWLQGK